MESLSNCCGSACRASRVAVAAPPPPYTNRAGPGGAAADQVSPLGGATAVPGPSAVSDTAIRCTVRSALSVSPLSVV